VASRLELAAQLPPIDLKAIVTRKEALENAPCPNAVG